MIKKWWQEIFDKKGQFEKSDWRTDNSIHKFLISNLDNNGNLTKEGSILPDEKIEDDKLKFAPGLKDAIFGSNESDDSKRRIAELSKHLKKIATSGNRINRNEFYKLITENDGVIGIIDQFLQEVGINELPIEPNLFSYAKDLASKSDNRNAVKFGIALLGLCQNKSVLKDIKILGLHDEFTVYSTIAIVNLSENVETDLWELAQKVNGWGKIQIVDRLARLDISQSIKDWLIYKGYKNNIMHEYLAYTCAVYGELHKKLENENINNQLFKSASDLIEALIATGGPAEDINSYSYAAKVIKDFIRHAKKHVTDISDFILLHNIKDFLIELQNDIEDQKENGWNQNVISNCLLEIFEIINSRDWKEITHEGLKSKDFAVYWNAKKAAEKLDIDLWETVWAKLEEQPLESSAWFDVINYSKPEHSDMIIDFALKKFPYKELSTGPKDSMGFGEDYNKFMSFDSIVSFLENYPKKGEVIILAALNSPVTRNRNVAIKVLDKWKQVNWSTEIDIELHNLYKKEPNKETKENIDRLLNGQKLK